MILDFTRGVDLIDLAAIDANTSTTGDQAFLWGGQNAGVVARSVTWFESGGNTVVQADNNGNTVADFRIVLAGTGLQISAADFVL